MKYYFVDHLGYITTEENVKGWFSKECNPNMFINKRAAISVAKKRIKAEIHLLKERLKGLRCK